MKQVILLIDFGSTYTKVTAVDVTQQEVMATEKSPTTISTNVTEGLNNALDNLGKIIGKDAFAKASKVASSSAAGGLRMDAIGFVPQLTLEAARMAVLNAGAKLINCYSNKLLTEDIESIGQDQIDILLLVGGTDGGNEDVLVHNAKMLSNSDLSIPIVVAGNRNCKEIVLDIFSKNNKNAIVTDNVLPEVNVLNIEPARNVIRNVFMKHIVHAKGMDEVKSYIDNVLLPTPAAILNGAKLLAEGTENEPGLGDLIIIDIGGATTDVHSVSEGLPSRPNIVLKGIPEPRAKRTVEGDLGVRFNAKSILESVGLKKFSEDLGLSPDIVTDWIEKITNETETVPQTLDEKRIDHHLAVNAVRIAVDRHVGRLKSHYTPMGEMFTLYGKDLTEVRTIIGTGGALIHSQDPSSIFQAACYSSKQPNLLKPKNVRFLLDSNYILYAGGLLSEQWPDLALQIMKKQLLEVKKLEGES